MNPYKPLPIPPGQVASSDDILDQVEAFVSAFIQVVKNGSVGSSTPDRETDPTILPVVVNGTPSFVPASVDSAAAQLFFRQLAHAIIASGIGGGGSPVVINEGHDYFTFSHDGAGPAFTLSHNAIAITAVLRKGIGEVGWTRVGTLLTLTAPLETDEDLDVRYIY